MLLVAQLLAGTFLGHVVLPTLTLTSTTMQQVLTGDSSLTISCGAPTSLITMTQTVQQEVSQFLCAVDGMMEQKQFEDDMDDRGIGLDSGNASSVDAAGSQRVLGSDGVKVDEEMRCEKLGSASTIGAEVSRCSSLASRPMQHVDMAGNTQLCSQPIVHDDVLAQVGKATNIDERTNVDEAAGLAFTTGADIVSTAHYPPNLNDHQLSDTHHPPSSQQQQQQKDVMNVLDSELQHLHQHAQQDQPQFQPTQLGNLQQTTPQ